MSGSIWPRAFADLFSTPGSPARAVFATGGAVSLLSLVALGEMPRRIVPVALLPVGALGSVVAQAKGFPYHFHPVTAGTHLPGPPFFPARGGRTAALPPGPAPPSPRPAPRRRRVAPR